MPVSVDERPVLRLLRFRWLLWLGILTLALGGALLWRLTHLQHAAWYDALDASRSLHEVRLRAHAAHVLASIAELRSVVPMDDRLHAMAALAQHWVLHPPLPAPAASQPSARIAPFFPASVFLEGTMFLLDAEGRMHFDAPKNLGNVEDDFANTRVDRLSSRWAAILHEPDGYIDDHWPHADGDGEIRVRAYRIAQRDLWVGAMLSTRSWQRARVPMILERLRTLARRDARAGSDDAEQFALYLIDRNGTSLLPASEATPQPDNLQAVALWLATGQRGGGVVRFAPQAREADSGKEAIAAHIAVVHPVSPWDWTLIVAAVDKSEPVMSRTMQSLIRQHQRCPWILPLVFSLGVGLLVAHAFARRMQTLIGAWRADDALQREERMGHESLCRAIFENAAVGMAQVCPQGRFLRVNQYFCDLLQRSREELLNGSWDYRTLTDPRDRAAMDSALQWAIQSKNPCFRLEKRFLRSDGSALWMSLAAQLVYTPQGEPDHFFVVAQDIQERKSVEQTLLLAASVFTSAREAIMITELDGTIVDVNESFTRITGYERCHAVGQNPRMMKSGRHNEAFYVAFWSHLQRYGHWHSEIWNRHKNGELFAAMQTISLVRDEHGQPRHYVALFSDITAVKRHQQQLEHMAHYDALTGLPNRALLSDRLQQSMLAVQRREQSLAVVYLDLDRFKAVNESIGHDAGDGVLAALATRMRAVLREGDTLARVGGDEFVAVLADLPDVASCAPLLDRLLAAAAEPVTCHGATVQASASLGVTFYPQIESIDAEQLLRQADQAMYQAKVAGKNRYHLFDAEHDRNVRGRHESIERMRNAMLQNELVLYYQPKVDMRTGRVIGAEALLRWQRPRRGLLLPGAFLPDIENHPFAIELGEWVIRTALRQVQDWLAESVKMCVSVNVGARQLQQGQFVERLRGILETFPHLPKGSLELEILESNALEDLEGVSQVIADCEALGVSFALDDFGTGYSSLTYLRRLPVKTIKIDQSFVRDMLEDADDLAILTGVIGLAQAFHRDVIAEGVETVDHGTALLQLGCVFGQGYGIARPMPAAAIPIWISEWQPDPAWNPEEAWRAQTDYRI